MFLLPIDVFRQFSCIPVEGHSEYSCRLFDSGFFSLFSAQGDNKLAAKPLELSA